MFAAKENYRAWTITPNEYPQNGSVEDQVRFFVRYGILAPSSHNSQPWKFCVAGNVVSIFPDRERALTICDPQERLLHIALGCVVENMVVAADYFGFDAVVDSTDMKEEIVMRFQKRAGYTEPKNEHLIFMIPKRAMDRSPYKKDGIPQDFQTWAVGLGNEDTIVDFASGERKDRIVGVMLEFKDFVFSHVPFRQELASFKRNNVTRAFVGMPGFTMGFPMLKSFVAAFAIRRLNVAKLTKKDDIVLLKQLTPAVVTINTKNDTAKDWVKVGRIFEKIALRGLQCGLHVAINAPPDEQGLLSSMQQEINSQYRPQLFFRIGFSDRVLEHSPRLPIEQVIK